MPAVPALPSRSRRAPVLVLCAASTLLGVTLAVRPHEGVRRASEAARTAAAEPCAHCHGGLLERLPRPAGARADAASSAGVAGGYAGSPKEGGRTCANASCHGGPQAVATSSQLRITLSQPAYRPGVPIAVTVSGTSIRGFQFTALRANGDFAGELVAASGTRLSPANGPAFPAGKYVTHTAQASSFSFQWVPPAASAGEITFYAAGKTAGFSNGTTYRTQLKVVPVAAEAEAEPGAFALLGATPNPAGAGVRVRFRLPWAAGVRLEVFDVGGRRVREVAEAGEAGETELRLSDLTPGLYFYHLTASGPSGDERRSGRFAVAR